jgi:hypothetical protein
MDVKPAPNLCLQMFAKRIEAQRMARIEADWKAAERSRRIRAVAQQERALREAFNEVRTDQWVGCGVTEGERGVAVCVGEKTWVSHCQGPNCCMAACCYYVT